MEIPLQVEFIAAILFTMKTRSYYFIQYKNLTSLNISFHLKTFYCTVYNVYYIIYTRDINLKIFYYVQV
jgi:hypothetical protein